MLCGEGTLVKENSQQLRLSPLRCRSWTCEECAPDRRRKLVAEARAGRPQRFITLTVNPEYGASKIDRARALAHAWRLVIRRWKRWQKIKARCGLKHSLDRWQYLAVFEATPSSGEPHLHILQRGSYVPQRWLSAAMRHFIGAPVVDVRAVRSRRAVSRYVTKYIGKAPQRFGTCKRYWKSQGYTKSKAQWRRENPDDSQYQAITEFIYTVAARYADSTVWQLEYYSYGEVRFKRREAPP